MFVFTPLTSVYSPTFKHVSFSGVEDSIEDISCLPLSWNVSGHTQVAVLTTTGTASNVVLVKLPNDLAEGKEGMDIISKINLYYYNNY